MRSSLAAVTNEKDSMSVTLTERTDRCQRLDGEVRVHEERAAKMECKNRELTRKVIYIYTINDLSGRILGSL